MYLSCDSASVGAGCFYGGTGLAFDGTLGIVWSLTCTVSVFLVPGFGDHIDA